MKRKQFVFSLLAIGTATPALAQYSLTTLVSFNGANGWWPVAGLISDTDGNLYGTTGSGPNNAGIVFEVAASTHALTTLETFNITNGANPNGLMFDAAGSLYGTTYSGGANNAGTVFQLVAGNALTTLATFNGANGAEPHGGLMSDSAGNLYGTTVLGGDLTLNSGQGLGTVFQMAAGTHMITTLATFNGSNGSEPSSNLISDAAGNLYGTTWQGGANNLGTVFKVAAGTHALTTLITFNGTNGSYVDAGLISDSAGNLYGTTYEGGANNVGTVFEVASGSHALTTLATFNNINGSSPWSGLIFDAAGNLYGTTQAGGANGDGTVFELPAGTDAFTTLAAFNGTNGNSPCNSSLLLDDAGNLYGTTSEGGADGGGTVFEVSPTSVPEPASLSLLGVGGLGLLARRRRQIVKK